MSNPTAHFLAAAQRMAYDPGVLFGVTQIAYNAPKHPAYAAITIGSLGLSLGIKLFDLFPRFKMAPLLLAGASLGVIAAHAGVTKGMDGMSVWMPAAAFAVANIARATELSAKSLWQRMTTPFQHGLNGENFAAVGVGLIAMFAAGPSNIPLTTLTALTVVTALGFGIKGRGDVARMLLGANAIVAVGAALAGDNIGPAIANAFSAAGSVRLWYIIREDKGLSVPYTRQTPKP